MISRMNIACNLRNKSCSVEESRCNTSHHPMPSHRLFTTCLSRHSKSRAVSRKVVATTHPVIRCPRIDFSRHFTTCQPRHSKSRAVSRKVVATTHPVIRCPRIDFSRLFTTCLSRHSKYLLPHVFVCRWVCLSVGLFVGGFVCRWVGFVGGLDLLVGCFVGLLMDCVNSVNRSTI